MNTLYTFIRSGATSLFRAQMVPPSLRDNPLTGLLAVGLGQAKIFCEVPAHTPDIQQGDTAGPSPGTAHPRAHEALVAALIGSGGAAAEWAFRSLLVIRSVPHGLSGVAATHRSFGRGLPLVKLANDLLAEVLQGHEKAAAGNQTALAHALLVVDRD